MMENRKTVVYPLDIMKWIQSVQKKEGFTGFSQTVIWILRKAMNNGKWFQKTMKTPLTEELTDEEIDRAYRISEAIEQMPDFMKFTKDLLADFEARLRILECSLQQTKKPDSN